MEEGRRGWVKGWKEGRSGIEKLRDRIEAVPAFPPLSKAHELLGMVLSVPGWVIVGRDA